MQEGSRSDLTKHEPQTPKPTQQTRKDASQKHHNTNHRMSDSNTMTSRSQSNKGGTSKRTTMKPLEQDGEESVTSLCSSISSEGVRRQEEGIVLPAGNPSSRPIPFFQQEEKGRPDPLLHRPRRPRKQLRKRTFLSKWWWWRWWGRKDRRSISRRKKKSTLQQLFTTTNTTEPGQQEQVLLWLFVLVVICAVIEIWLVNVYFFGRHYSPNNVWGTSLASSSQDVFEPQVVLPHVANNKATKATTTTTTLHHSIPANNNGKLHRHHENAAETIFDDMQDDSLGP